MLCNVSRQFVDKVVRQANPEEKTEERTLGSFRFLPHVAWSIDFFCLRINSVLFYAALLIEEASRKKLGAVVSREQKAQTAISLVEMAKRRYGILPLVLKHDGGPQFKAGAFQDCLKEHRIISLPSVFYYPRYNGRMERMVREVKGHLPQSFDRQDINTEIRMINSVPRRMLGGKTNDQAFWETIPQKDFERDYFIREAQEIKQETGSALAWKGGDAKFQRIAVEEVLKKHQLCLFTKGKTLQIGSG